MGFSLLDAVLYKFDVLASLERAACMNTRKPGITLLISADVFMYWLLHGSKFKARERMHV